MANAFLARSSHREKSFEGAVMTSTHPELLQNGQVQVRSQRKQLQLMIKQEVSPFAMYIGAQMQVSLW